MFRKISQWAYSLYLLDTNSINQNKLKYSEKVINLIKKNDIGFTYKGIIFKRSDFKNALKYFEKALHINPENYHNLLNLGISTINNKIMTKR